MNLAELTSCIFLTDSDGEVIYSSIEPQCMTCVFECSVQSEIVSRCGTAGKHRRGSFATTDGQVFFCSKDRKYVESSKLFKAQIKIYSEMIGYLVKAKNSIARQEVEKSNRLFHNLTSLNAHTIQELYAFVPQQDLSGSFSEQKRVVEQKLSTNLNEAAEMFLRILKNEMSLKYEISVYKKLYDPNPAIAFASHPIHKVVLNTVNLFSQTLAEKSVELIIYPTDARLSFDYESMQVILYHIMENSAKYSEPSSTIYISFEESDVAFLVAFDMTSLYIHPDEIENIFKDGYSGRQTRFSRNAGNGLGMGISKKLLELNGAQLVIIPGEPVKPGSRLAPEGLLFAKNRIAIKFDISRVINSGGSVYAKRPTRLSWSTKT
jgi:light-regulated signal transduction histidine kinase (bacteriophytochrome)